ncbi:Pimeloyl-ACP methyl ester carboxylesterase [Asanoa hainanensis]|uniref:Pimeloyl-ACP methyl ester carboxylesterase n=1 Tax=Asanoa hainanensis TaxID=560556 RepID=A0A239MB07_9ACTN|nr:alpha/beta hydrolase [Asanoa hainanensis]SNT39925.1 Pimeloyl-ACP methyl ester carboxylesterase [Asanoa hainanensis]
MRMQTRGLTFEVTEGGPPGGPPVILLHGFPQNRHSWAGVTAHLNAAGLRTFAIDQRGYSPGARPSGVDAYRQAECVADAVAFVDELAGGRADVVGHDFGALVGWQLAAAHPARVRSLTAVCVPHPAAFAQAVFTDPDQQRRSSYIQLFLMVGKAEAVLTSDDGARLRTMLAGTGDIEVYAAPLLEPGALTPALNWYRALSIEELAKVGPVERPTTFVWGDRDTAVGLVAASAAGEHVTGDYRFLPLPGVDHWVPEAQPEVLAQAILARIADAS